MEEKGNLKQEIEKKDLDDLNCFHKLPFNCIYNQVLDHKCTISCGSAQGFAFLQAEIQGRSKC